MVNVFFFLRTYIMCMYVCCEYTLLLYKWPIVYKFTNEEMKA